ncbi:ribose 5-phosphate isomerase A-domain-containing protein [Nemania sp. NC0429]|nr:ribose 5-phosphate isomerase A-domain-containing protein [Nemania sp. NC0429]
MKLKLPARAFFTAAAAPAIAPRDRQCREAFIRSIDRLLTTTATSTATSATSTITATFTTATATAAPTISDAAPPRPVLQLDRRTRTRSHDRRPLPPSHVHVRPAPRRTMATTGAAVDATLVEAAKRAACQQAVKDHYSPDFRYVGIGSGSTIAYVVEAIAALGPSGSAGVKFVPTGAGSTRLIRDAGLAVLQVPELLREAVGFAGPSRQILDVYFDGADEVDAELSCIKGGGACLFQEKVVARLARRFVCVADSRKRAPRLLTGWRYVPVEVSPVAAELVRQALVDLGSVDPVIRAAPSSPSDFASSESGYLVTDNHNYLIDAPFPTLLLNSQADLIDPAKGIWTPEALTAKIRGILGVLEVGIFSGLTGPQAAAAGPGAEGVRPVKVYYGKTDGGVETQE